MPLPVDLAGDCEDDSRSTPERDLRLIATFVGGSLVVIGLLLYKPGGYLVDPSARLADINWLALTDAGFRPYLDFWVERPPLLTIWLFLAYRVSLLFPPWLDWRLPFAVASGLPAVAGAWLAIRSSHLLAGSLRATVLASSFGLLFFTVSSSASIGLGILLWATSLGVEGRWYRAAILAGLAPLIGSPLVLATFATIALANNKPRAAALSLVPLGGASTALLLAGYGASLSAWLAFGGEPIFVATELRLEPSLAPFATLSLLWPAALVGLAAVLPIRRQSSIVRRAAVVCLLGSAWGAWSGPSSLLLALPWPLLVLPAGRGFVLSALIGIIGAITMSFPGNPILSAVQAIVCLVVAFMVVVGADSTAGQEFRSQGDKAGWQHLPGSERWLQLASLITLRVGSLVLLRPFGYFGEWNDFDFFLRWARLAESGLFPFRDFWMEHPPIFPGIVVSSYQLSRLLPALPDGHAWFNLVLGLLLLPAEIGSLLAIRRLATICGNSPSVAGWAFVLSFPALFFWTAGFDGLPLAFLLMGMAASAGGRPAWAGFFVGLGAMTKVLPAAALPAILAAGRRSAWRALTAFLLTVVFVSAPVIVMNPRMALASAQSLTTRGSWDSVWALLDGYYRGGELVPPEKRVDPQSVFLTTRPSVIPWLPLAGLAASGYLALLMKTKRPLDQRRSIAWAAAGVLGLILVSKGWSPQFVVYPMGFLFLLFPARRAIVYALNLLAAVVFEYPFALLLLDNLPVPLAVAVVWRTLTLSLIVVELLAIGLGRDLRIQSLVRLLRVAPIALVPLVAWAVLYYRSEWIEADDPYRSLIDEASKREVRIATVDDDVFRRLAAFLPGKVYRPAAGRLDGRILTGEWWLVEATGDTVALAEVDGLMSAAGAQSQAGPYGTRRYLIPERAR